MCAQCKKKKQDDVHPYTKRLLFLRRMIRGGRPYKAGELSDDEWFLLGLINELIDSLIDSKKHF
jgi:hypothetical protein